MKRLAVVYADELRLRINTELFMRVMSPKLFYGTFGGSTLSRVDAHFKKLAEHNWLRLIYAEEGEGRRGGKEHFYRSTELAVFDTATWSLLPHPVRAVFSLTTFKQFAERLNTAMERGTFDRRPSRHLSWTPILVDQLGWERVTTALDSLFESLSEEQEDVKIRIFGSGEMPALMTVALAGFESPSEGAEFVSRAPISSFENPSIPITYRLSKVFDDEVALSILTEASLRDLSIPAFLSQCPDETYDSIRRRFKLLEHLGWMVFVNEKTGGDRRGGREKFYRAIRPAIFGPDEWSALSMPAKKNRSRTTFKQLIEQITKAMEAGTFDSRTDRHFSWTPLRVDSEGWTKVIKSVDDLFTSLEGEAEQAEDRMRYSGESPIRMTVALAGFESPPDTF